MALPSDAAPLALPLDASEKAAANPAPMQTLGGDLLTEQRQEAYEKAYAPYEQELKTYWDDVAAGKKVIIM